MNSSYIGENIKIYRERLNLTQQQLADKIGKTWEMVSRYERGASSPMNQLDSLSKALKVTPADLVKDITKENFSNDSFRIPLFINIPINFEFRKVNTYTYYSVPEWIFNLDPDTFALDMNLVDGTKGIVYISPNSEINLGDMVLVNDANLLRITNVKTFKGLNIIGRVIAQEIRY